MAGLLELLLGPQKEQEQPQYDKFGIEIVPGLMGQGAPPPTPGINQHYGDLFGGREMTPTEMKMLMRMIGRGR